MTIQQNIEKLGSWFRQGLWRDARVSKWAVS